MQKPKSFRPWQPDQTTLLPPSPREWLIENHQVYFLLDLVEELDLSEILIPAQAKDPRGKKGYDPQIPTLLLAYAYCVGRVSSRKIERALHQARWDLWSSPCCGGAQVCCRAPLNATLLQVSGSGQGCQREQTDGARPADQPRHRDQPSLLGLSVPKIRSPISGCTRAPMPPEP